MSEEKKTQAKPTYTNDGYSPLNEGYKVSQKGVQPLKNQTTTPPPPPVAKDSGGKK